MEKFKKSWNFHGRTITVENGEIAKQAGGSVLVRYDDTVVLSAATASSQAKDTDFFPLTVVYNEKMYAKGEIPGGFLRREIGSRLQLRYTPELVFEEDDSIAYGAKMFDLLRSLDVKNEDSDHEND